MRGWLGIGRQTVDADPAADTRYYPVVPEDFDICEHCDAIRRLDDLTVRAIDEETGMPVYQCAGGCPA